MTDDVVDDVVVHMADVRAAKVCSRGSRAFLRSQGLDWDKFLKEGIPASTLEATGNALAINVAEVARGRRK